MQRILSYGTDFATSNPFVVPAGAKVKVWMVREDTVRNPSPRDRVEVQIRDQSTSNWTTIYYLSHEQPSVVLGPVDEDVTYRAYRLQQMHAIAVDRTEVSADAKEGRHAAQPNFVPANQLVIDNTAPPVSCSEMKLIYATNPANADQVGIQRTFPTADPTDFGALTSGDIRGLFDAGQSGVFSYIQDTLTGDATLHISRTGAPSLAAFEGGTLSLLNPNGSVASNITITAADILSPTEISMTIPAADGLPVLPNTSQWMAVCPAGMTYAPPVAISNGGRFTLDQNDVPARLSAFGFDPDAPFEEVRLYAVEAGTPIPLTYDESGDPIRLIESFPAFTIVAPGEYEWRRTNYSNIAVYLNTGWR